MGGLFLAEVPCVHRNAQGFAVVAVEAEPGIHVPRPDDGRAAPEGIGGERAPVVVDAAERGARGVVGSVVAVGPLEIPGAGALGLVDRVGGATDVTGGQEAGYEVGVVSEPVVPVDAGGIGLAAEELELRCEVALHR